MKTQKIISIVQAFGVIALIVYGILAYINFYIPQYDYFVVVVVGVCLALNRYEFVKYGYKEIDKDDMAVMAVLAAYLAWKAESTPEALISIMLTFYIVAASYRKSKQETK
jgi:hypothetical protein